MNYHEQLVKETFNKNNSQHQHEKTMDSTKLMKLMKFV